VRAGGTQAVVEASLERWFTRAAGSDVVERARRDLLAVAPEGYAGCCEAIAAYDLRERLHAIQAPTLVIATEDDPSAPPEHGRLIADAIEGTRLVVLHQGRHLVSVERPDLVNPLLLEHLTAGAAV
jgi:pimeloyl-ACP methyl ester carboxylesterase